ncbi:MAG: hypothetical protein M1827_005943 [Pycnora praestabilis]|nr:MAG: hypothetical protein M1827_005943 [Pycnora praestabilis]
MAALGSGRPERVYHQDYIARIRYSNALPPPPNPPKLLDIPNTGLASGQYTSAGYASRMAREQPLNIEANAELGMPIDLVGMPGIFDGDESSIQSPANPPPLDPRDRALLRPLSTMGKPSSLTSGVSFLRRTEYISNEQSRSRIESTTSKNLIKSTGTKVRRKSDVARDDPDNILRHVQKGFNIAYPHDINTESNGVNGARGAIPTKAELDAWANPKHPTNPELTVIDSYPVLPDLDAYPDTGGYITMKFNTNPVVISDVYDERLDVGLLRPLALSPEVEARLQAQAAAHEADPSKPPAGPPPFDYEYFLPQEEQAARNIKRMLNVDDPGKDDPLLYTNQNQDTEEGFFRYKRIRAYETFQVSGSSEDQYSEVTIALHDPLPVDSASTTDQTPRLQKAAYFYPILQKAQIRPRRAANIAALGLSQGPRTTDEDTADRVDYVDVMIREPDSAEAARRAEHREMYDVRESAEA